VWAGYIMSEYEAYYEVQMLLVCCFAGKRDSHFLQCARTDRVVIHSFIYSVAGSEPMHTKEKKKKIKGLIQCTPPPPVKR